MFPSGSYTEVSRRSTGKETGLQHANVSCCHPCFSESRLHCHKEEFPHINRSVYPAVQAQGRAGWLHV